MSASRVRSAAFSWIAAGALLDTAALALLWLGQAALGLGSTFGSAWPVATVFATVPWATHVLLLPWLTGGPRAQAGRSAVLTAAYIAGAAFLIPAVAALLAFLGLATGVFEWPVWNLLGGLLSGLEPHVRRRVTDMVGAFAFIVWIGGPVGGAIGAMGGLLRRGLGESAAYAAPWPTDVLGGSAAAVIALCGLGLATTGGLSLDFAAASTQLLATAVGVLAYTPHLVLTARLNRPRATSACGAAPNAPCR